tara:strand:- start:2116 stop:2454 length:339 start_codon:yes stop_codon:yes gene_type:complete
MEKKMNKELIKLIKERLDMGAKKYGEELDVNDGRDWIKESLEEQLDSIVYTAAKLLQLKKKIDNYGPPYTQAQANQMLKNKKQENIVTKIRSWQDRRRGIKERREKERRHDE